MQQLLGIDAGAPYDARLQQLAARGVGLWDVIGECARRGSLDAAIVPGSIVVNPLPERLATLPQLRLVVCKAVPPRRRGAATCNRRCRRR